MASTHNISRKSKPLPTPIDNDPLRSQTRTSPSSSFSSPAPLVVDPNSDLVDLHSAASDREVPSQLNSKINDFMKELSRPKYSRPLNYDQIVALFQQCYKEYRSAAEILVKGTVGYNKVELKDFSKRTTTLENQENEKRIRDYCEICEYKMCTAFYDRLFTKNEENLKINKFINTKISIIKKIKNLNFANLLEIHDVDLHLPLLKQISKDFDNFQAFKTPLQKVSNLMNIHTHLNRFLKEHLNSNINGDYILPLLIYLILANDSRPIHDYYLNFTYIKNFRSHESLIGNSLYCLTNFEAALTFIQTLSLAKYSEFEPPLTKEEEHLKNQGEVNLMNSNFFTNTFDSSFKLLNKFKPSPSSITESEDNPIKNFVGDVMKWTRTASAAPVTAATNTTREIISRSRASSMSNKNSSISSNNNPNSHVYMYGVDIDRFKDRSFNELTINELHTLFNDHQNLTKHLRKQQTTSITAVTRE